MTRDTEQRILDELQRIKLELETIKKRLGERLWTLDMVAREFRVSKRTVRRRIKSGLLKPIPGEGHPRFTAEEVARAKEEKVFERRWRT